MLLNHQRKVSDEPVMSAMPRLAKATVLAKLIQTGPPADQTSSSPESPWLIFDFFCATSHLYYDLGVKCAYDDL